MSRSRSTTPTAKPTRSKWPGSSMPGSSAISPPMRAQPASLHPWATPATSCSIWAGSRRPTLMQSRKNSGSAPWAAMSSTDMATRSMPMVSKRPARRATTALVPTPSVAATSTGRTYRVGSKANRPPNPPTSPMTSGRKVDRTAALIRSTASSPAPMSTPAPAYVSPTGWLATGMHQVDLGQLVVAPAERDGHRVVAGEAGGAEARGRRRRWRRPAGRGRGRPGCRSRGSRGSPRR